MAIYRNVQMSFWTDRKIEEDFSADEKYLYLFLLTNPMTNLCGCYEIGKKQIANMTGIDVKKVSKLLKKLQDDQKVIAYSEETSELLLPNWHKYNWTNSEKFRQPLLKEIESVKYGSFREYLMGVFNGSDTVSIPYPYGTDTTVTDTVTDTVTVTDTDAVQTEVIESYSEDPRVDAAIHEFIDYRKNEKKDPMGDLAITKFVNRLFKLSDDPDVQISCIDRAIASGWKTVYEPEGKARSGTTQDRFAMIDAWARGEA